MLYSLRNLYKYRNVSYGQPTTHLQGCKTQSHLSTTEPHLVHWAQLHKPPQGSQQSLRCTPQCSCLLLL